MFRWPIKRYVFLGRVGSETCIGATWIWESDACQHLAYRGSDSRHLLRRDGEFLNRLVLFSCIVILSMCFVLIREFLYQEDVTVLLRPLWYSTYMGKVIAGYHHPPIYTYVKLLAFGHCP